MIYGLIAMVALVGLLLLGFGASFALGLASTGYFAISRGIEDIPFSIIAQRLVAGVDSFTLLAIPLFILVGHLMNDSGATTKLFNFANSLVGHFRGGLAQVNVLASMLFAGMSGSGTADAAGLGAIEMKAMRDAGYDDRTTIGVTVSSSLIGPIIPPSIPAILYAVLAQVSAADMLLAGLIPGILMSLALMALAFYYSITRKLPKERFAGLAVIWGHFLSSFATLLTPVILMGGIVLGVFTATEAAAVAALWALVLATMIYRTLGIRQVMEVFRKAAYDSAVILFILACSGLFAWILTRARIPDTIANWIANFTSSPFLMMLLMVCFLLCVGCFLSVAVAINVLTPILVPVVVAFGYDPVHFGVIMIMLLVIGEATPPFGMVLYVITKLSGRPFEFVVTSSFPWLVVIFLVVVLVILFPQLALLLPEMIR